MERLYHDTESEHSARKLNVIWSRPCTTCNGKRLKPEALAVTIDGKNIMDVSEMSRYRYPELGQ